MYDLLTESTPATQAIPPTDGERLMRFVRHRDEAAFAEVVETHSALVWSVCWQVLRQRQDAEDAFQGTFLILARKAHTIKANDSAAAWLYRVAFRTSLRLKERRGRRREEPLAEEQFTDVALAMDDQLDAVAASEQISALMEELHALPARYQHPLILHYFESKSRAAIAEELGCTTAAIKGRLARARGMLRSRLARRGVALSVAMAVTASAFEAAATMLPIALPAGTAGLALAFRTKLPLPDGAEVVGSLANKGIAAMTVATMMKPAAGVLAVALAAVLLAQVNAEEDVRSPSGKSASVAVDLVAADDLKSAKRSRAEVDVPVQVERPANRKPVTINPTTGLPPTVGRDFVANDDLEVKKPESPIVAPTQPPQPYEKSSPKPVPVLDWTAATPTYAAPPAIKMGSAIELPAGGKKQLELEMQYWELKAESLKLMAEAKVAERQAIRSGEGSEKALYFQEQLASAESLMSKAESYLALSKKAELEGRLKQIERLEKLEKRLQENPPRPTTGQYQKRRSYGYYQSSPATRDAGAQNPVPTDVGPQPTRQRSYNSAPQPAGRSDRYGSHDHNGMIDPGETINIQVIGAYPDQPISGNYDVEPMGTVALGPSYGRVKVAGKTLIEAEELIKAQLSELLKEVEVQVTSAKYPERSRNTNDRY